MGGIESWLNRTLAERRIRRRRDEVARAIQAHFRIPVPLVLAPGRGRGNDSTYVVSDTLRTLGVLRLVNPYRTPRTVPPDMPFVLNAPMARLEREWTAYEQASPIGLTPRPVWRTHDAIMCSHLPYRPMQDMLEAAPDRAWKLLIHATRRLHSLHHVGMAHMDASLANILADDGLNHLAFIDFECAPAAHVPPAAQRLYDHLRLIENAWNLIPPKLRVESGAWFDTLEGCLDDDMRETEMKLLAPALKKILAAPEFAPRLGKILGRKAQG